MLELSKVAFCSSGRQFMELTRKREIGKRLDPALFHEGCLLCSENTPHHCHRRLVAEYLREQWGAAVEIRHLDTALDQRLGT